jgi:hypothetical protein
LLGAQSGSADETFSYIGRPDGSLAALGEFTKIVRSFWIGETSERFGYDEETTFNQKKDGQREATSAAARLVEGAAKILNARFDLGKVREVMEAVNRDSHLPPLLRNIVDRSEITAVVIPVVVERQSPLLGWRCCGGRTE